MAKFTIWIKDDHLQCQLLCEELKNPDGTNYCDKQKILKLPFGLRLRIFLARGKMYRRLRKLKSLYAKYNA